MTLFRRTSTTVETHPIASQNVQGLVSDESRRKSSLATIPSRLRRRKTKTSTENLEDAPLISNRLGQLFFALPSEILTQIISYLPLPDLFALRRSSKFVVSILNDNASVICRRFISKGLSEEVTRYAFSLYPTLGQSSDLRQLFCMLHRKCRTEKAHSNTLSYIHMKSYVVSGFTFGTSARTPWGRQRLEQSLRLPSWTAYHFLEKYRDIVIDKHDSQHDDGSGRFWGCQMCKTKARDLVRSYAPELVCPTFHYLQLLMLHFQAATRPPSVGGGPFERKFRTKNNYISEEDTSIFVILGGVEELSRISVMHASYAKRVNLVSNFVQQIRKAADDNQSKSNTSHFVTPQQAEVIPSVQNNMAVDQHNSGAGIKEEITTLLDPPYSALTQDHIDRLPPLQDFLLPIWQERIDQDNLHTGEPEDLETPFRWLERILAYSDEDTQEEETLNHNDNAQGSDGNNNNNIQEAVNNPTAAAGGGGVNSSLNLFTAHTPSNLVPIFGASPV